MILTDMNATDYLQVNRAWLERITPPNRLHFFDVKQGWEPLCKILDVPVPDVPFPHVNDAEMVQKVLTSFIKQAVITWIVILTIMALLGSGLWVYWPRS
jgi:hypothetical protein